MSKKGITLIEIVVVIIILILLAVIAIYNSNKMSLKAEAVAVQSEFQALYTSLTNLQTQDNLGLIDFKDEGTHVYYNYKLEENGETWYYLYGKDGGYSEEVVKNLGLDNLKRSYRYRLRNEKKNKDDIYIEYLNGSVKIGNYSVKSYDDIINLMNSGAI